MRGIITCIIRGWIGRGELALWELELVFRRWGLCTVDPSLGYLLSGCTCPAPPA